MAFEPKLDILPASQRRLWGELIDVPETFTLYGGTAIALHLGHRDSVDFDFFGTQSFEPDRLYGSVPFLQGSEVLQKSPDTLTCRVDRGGPVQVSFFGVPTIQPILPPAVVESLGLKVASLLDLAGMKASVVQQRIEAKDYIDIDALIHQGKLDLPTALAAARQIYGESFNPQITLKALSYFEGGNLGNVDQAIRNRLVNAVKAVDLDQLPVLAQHLPRNDGSPRCKQ